jgi:hypothetical protein
MNDGFGKDQFTGFLKRATDILFILNPKETSMGVICGVLLDGLIKLFNPVLTRQQIIDFSAVGIIYWILFGIFLFNLPSILRRQPLDPKIEAVLASIHKSKREGSISPAQERIMYKSLYEKVLAEITLDKPLEEKIQDIENLSGSSDTPSS